ncbi:deoxynucleoside kinase [Marinomonas sp. C2222]|uniref:Deoxynucleoside kinase n=1 Tax=Marinomonas sargassi TaxID=2984494 RepID=A0ABT2YSR7_9GAMM|nr:deoxynucleoside kinase [Marinomonas sargassi]MCV2402930.1 deoxynucleoside kinase [Marinomonas sargassi]
MNNGIFIVIEGLDGTGKSTTAKALATALEGVALNTPLDKFKEVRPKLEGIYGKESYGRQLFYASTAIASSNEVREKLESIPAVVLDRYWLSTQVYHSWRTQGAHFQLLEVEGMLLKPDLTVYLELSLEERIKRLGGRSDNTDEDRQTMGLENNQKLNELYHAYNDSPCVGKWLTVDASLSTVEIVDKVIQYLNK